MNPISITQNKIYNTAQTSPIPVESKETTVSSYAQNPIKNSVSFTAEMSTVGLKTKLTTKEEKEKYSKLVSSADKKTAKKLEVLLKNGILLNTKSNDKSSTLDNLYKIITTPRAQGLDAKVVLAETVKIIANPFVITQQFGDIPQEELKNVLTNGAKNLNKESKTEINEQTINVKYSAACVAASIEFNLAQQTPSEFSRFAEELSSPKLAVDKTIQIKNLADNSLDAVWLLNAFKIPYEMKNFDQAKLKIAPDKNALLRAQIQNSHKDLLERSLIDVLMQSTFMNVGSQQTYDSLTDIRGGKFSQDQQGLVEFEKTFTESIVEDKNKVSITYQILDEDGKLTGYETDFNTIKKHILDALAMGENVIVGYTHLDGSNEVVGGHEITILDSKTDKDGNLIFVCNDTDDDDPRPTLYKADYIIPKIHHAGLPQKVVANDVNFVDTWVDGINAYKEMKKQDQKA